MMLFPNSLIGIVGMYGSGCLRWWLPLLRKRLSAKDKKRIQLKSQDPEHQMVKKTVKKGSDRIFVCHSQRQRPKTMHRNLEQN